MYFDKYNIIKLLECAGNGDTAAWYQLCNLNKPFTLVNKTAVSDSGTLIESGTDAEELVERLTVFIKKRHDTLLEHKIIEPDEPLRLTDFLSLMLLQKKYAQQVDGRWETEDRAPQDDEQFRWCIDLYEMQEQGISHHACVIMPEILSAPVCLVSNGCGYSIHYEDDSISMLNPWNLIYYCNIPEKRMLAPTEAEIEDLFFDKMVDNPPAIVISESGKLDFIISEKKFRGELTLCGMKVIVQHGKDERKKIIASVNKFKEQCYKLDDSVREYIAQHLVMLSDSMDLSNSCNPIELMQLQMIDINKDKPCQLEYAIPDDNSLKITVSSYGKRLKLLRAKCESNYFNSWISKAHEFAAQNAFSFWNRLWNKTDCGEDLEKEDYYQALQFNSLQIDENKNVSFMFFVSGPLRLKITLRYRIKTGFKLEQQHVEVDPDCIGGISPESAFETKLCLLDRKAREYAALCLLDFWNEDWRDQELEDELSADQFAEYLVLQSIQSPRNKELQFCYFIANDEIPVRVDCKASKGFFGASLG